MGRRKGGWEGESCLRSCCGCDSRPVFRDVWIEATLSLWGRVSRRHLAVETRSCVFVQCKPCNLVNKFKPIFFWFLEDLKNIVLSIFFSIIWMIYLVVLRIERAVYVFILVYWIVIVESEKSILWLFIC